MKSSLCVAKVIEEISVIRGAGDRGEGNSWFFLSLENRIHLRK